ncbi:MAG: GH1 family beta-glucosidase [Opitutus sp.]|nr:GH1 family beta-glucosidase [Opitutus sp.]
MAFSKNFVWGAATSSFQIEGALEADGRGRTVWDAFCEKPGKVHGGDTGAVACDHYHRSKEDVALMREIGLQAYRFSLAWSRILPEGVGQVSEAGLGFYDRLVDDLLAAGVQPWVTLFHWDYPLALYQRGGWLHEDSPKWFADYTRVVVDRLSDRVQHWMTLNEPQCFVGLGHQTGIHAPGDQLPQAQVLLAAHRVLVAHGLAVQTIRQHAKKPAVIGWAPTGDVPVPETNSAADIEAAREAYYTVRNGSVWNQAWWLDPVFKGEYPAQGLEVYGADAPKFTAEEMRTIRQPLDFLGLNIYNGYHVRRAADGSVEQLPRQLGNPQTHMHWNVTPPALYWGPRFQWERYGLPIVITENGMSGHDWVALDGHVHDPARIDYLSRYLRELRRSAADGVDVRGYFQWTLMDNFEWAEGYRYRFGLVHVDFNTQKRTLKDSARWYGELIRSNGATLPA